MLFGKKKEKTFKEHEIKTTAARDALSVDSNKDGIPDYLQREKLKPISKRQLDSNLQEVDPAVEKENLVMKWQGYRYDPSEGVFVPKSPPMINEAGIMKLSQILDSHVHKIAMTTNIKLEYAHIEIVDVMRTVHGWLADNYRTWGISSSDLDPISIEIEALIFYTLSKSIDDKQRQHVTNRTRITESKTIPTGPVL